MVFGRVLLCWLFALSATGLVQAEELLRIATSTSTKNSGLMDHLLPQFISETGYRIELYAIGTGPALRFGQIGKVDVLLVHAPAAERRFVDQGYGLERLPVMHNDFVIVGPADDPAGIRGSADAKTAFERIAKRGHSFISRGDDSGTHKKEMRIWLATGIDPYGRDWYLESGLSIGQTLLMTSELRAYTLSDRGTWLANMNSLQLSLLVASDKALHNPYHLIAINPDRHKEINHAAAVRFIDWLRSARIQQLIADYRVAGQSLFVPDVHP